MSKPQSHFAQINVAPFRASLDDLSMADSASHLVPINQLGHRAPGFVWQLLNDNGDSTTCHFFDDLEIVVNLTAWESIESLFKGSPFTITKDEHKDLFDNCSALACHE